MSNRHHYYWSLPAEAGRGVLTSLIPFQPVLQYSDFLLLALNDIVGYVFESHIPSRAEVGLCHIDAPLVVRYHQLHKLLIYRSRFVHL
jgi:hypothetical protein